MAQQNCTDTKCPNYGRYCRIHIKGSLKTPKPIAPRSKKLAEIMKKEYVPQVKEMVEAGTKCVIGSPVCTKVATGFHHKRGREGKLLTDKKHKVPCCNPCNQWIEKNDAHARAMGWKDSKHKNYKREPKI
jgi:hypothetical protein